MYVCIYQSINSINNIIPLGYKNKSAIPLQRDFFLFKVGEGTNSKSYQVHHLKENLLKSFLHELGCLNLLFPRATKEINILNTSISFF